jgi:hypothetical protein
VGRGPARHTRLISPVALPRPLRPPALAPGSSLLRVADTFDPITGMAEREVKYTESHAENIALRRYNLAIERLRQGGTGARLRDGPWCGRLRSGLFWGQGLTE